MPSYTIVLTDTQQLALDYEMERPGRLQPPAEPGTQPPPRTAQEILQHYVAQYLDNLALEVQPVLTPLRAMLRIVEPDARTALIAAIEPPSLQTYLRRTL